MPYEYRPLRGREIRLLTIESVEGDATPSTPICCWIEHVDLPSASRTRPSKGQNYIWQETYAQRNVAAIFKDTADSIVSGDTIAASVPDEVNSLLTSDDSLPWQYDWGDFVALSYLWGPPTPVQHIVLNGHSFSVGPNLFQALVHLRSHQRIRQGFKIWIDAICINQGDLAERSVQVGRMREIYSAAWHVIIWLGPEADDSELAVCAISVMAARNRNPDPYDGFYRETTEIDARPLFIKWKTFKTPLKKSVYKALFSYLSRPYWQRMWIIQEVAMARQDAPVVCGRSCLPWRDIHNAAMFISNDEPRFGRELVGSVRARIMEGWSFEMARDRLVHERDWSSERMWKLLIDITSVQHYQYPQADLKQAVRHPYDVLRPLILARDAKITEEKDRVYGILGIRAVADRVHIVPDYTLSLAVIYRDFTAQLMSQGNLDILRFVSRGGGQIRAQWNLDDVPTALSHRKIAPVVGPVWNSFANSTKQDLVGTICFHELPTWAVCWTCKPAPTAQLRGPYQAGGSKTAAQPVLSPINHTLTVEGVIFDTISNLSSFHPAEEDDKYPQNSTTLSTSAYGSLEATRTALWRTLLGGTTAEGGVSAPEAGAWLLESKIWQRGVAGVHTNGFGLNDLMARNAKLVLGGYTLEQLIHGVNKSQVWKKTPASDQIYNPTQEQREILSWAVNATAWRRLVCTASGRIGLAPAAARIDDTVAVLLGCSTPMCIRRSGDHWEVVGECYVHGVMGGEVLDAALETEEVTLC